MNWIKSFIQLAVLSLLLSACGDNSSPNSNTKVDGQMGGSIQVAPLILSKMVSTFAGSLLGSSDGIGSNASFHSPQGIATDGRNIYVTDYANNTIRMVDIATGAVTTLAGSAGISGATDGIGGNARFDGPIGISTDGTNIYVADYNNKTIRKLVIATKIVTTLAGSPGIPGSVDGAGTAARFAGPNGITTDGLNLFVTDAGGNNTIRKVAIGTGLVTTLAGSPMTSGSTDGIGVAARFDSPAALTTDGTYLYVVDYWNGTIRKVVIDTAVVTTLAGSALNWGASDGVGLAARFHFPTGITSDGTNLFIVEFGNNTVRKLESKTGVVTTIAGQSGRYGSTDGTGSSASFMYPQEITTDGRSLFVTDSGNNMIRRID